MGSSRLRSGLTDQGDSYHFGGYADIDSGYRPRPSGYRFAPVCLASLGSRAG